MRVAETCRFRRVHITGGKDKQTADQANLEGRQLLCGKYAQTGILQEGNEV